MTVQSSSNASKCIECSDFSIFLLHQMHFLQICCVVLLKTILSMLLQWVEETGKLPKLMQWMEGRGLFSFFFLSLWSMIHSLTKKGKSWLVLPVYRYSLQIFWWAWSRDATRPEIAGIFMNLTITNQKLYKCLLWKVITR